jgi:thymidylate synthase ThyX
MKVDYIQHCGSDLTVVNAARVSFDKESVWAKTFDGRHREGELTLKDINLVQYLARNQHTSPFNHSFLTVRVKAPIFVARQLVKHKFMPWNEISRRYVDSEPEFYEPDVWRFKADNVKQGSRSSGLTSHEVNTELCNREEANGYIRTPDEGNEDCLDTYRNLLQYGCLSLNRLVWSYLSRCTLSGTGVAR